MRKLLFASIVVATMAVSAWAVVHVARGRGVVEGGSHAGANFEFSVTVPYNSAHPNRFRFWDHGMFIPVDIVVPHIERVTFEHHAVHFSGRGWYNNSTPVRVFVTALDGGVNRHDMFRMVARDMAGAVVHSAEGRVIEGGIEIFHRQ
ncbi:MAG: hypothetical protein ABIV13_02800 [Fimbriimonadales bacterium]